MLNRLKFELDHIRNEGLSPSAIVIKKSGDYWQVAIMLDDGHHPLEGFNVDTKDLPTGVSIGGWQRLPDRLFTIASDPQQIELWLDELLPDAQDWARFDGDDPSYPHYIVKPNAWRSPPFAARITDRQHTNVAGSNSGRKQRQKDKVSGTYPRPGLPINQSKGNIWTKSYQRSYYSPNPAQRMPEGEVAKVSVTVRVDANLLENVRSAKINISRACQAGLMLALQGCPPTELT